MSSEDLERGGPGGTTQGVAVTPEEEGSADPGGLPEFADGLGRRCDVVIIERGVEGAAAMAGGAEAHPLCWILRVRMLGVVGRDQGSRIDQIVLGGR